MLLVLIVNQRNPETGIYKHDDGARTSENRHRDVDCKCNRFVEVSVIPVTSLGADLIRSMVSLIGFSC